MKLLLVVVPDSTEIPALEGTLVSAVQVTSANPTPPEIQARCKDLVEAVCRQLMQATEVP